jgi:Spy/CpxP family protein refolding chaperone
MNSVGKRLGTLTLLLAGALTAFPVFAQQAPLPPGDAPVPPRFRGPAPENDDEGRRPGARRGPRDPQQQIAVMKQELELSDEQSKKVETIFADNRKEMEELRTKHQGQGAENREAARADMMANRQKLEKQIAGVLSKEQNAKWAQIQQRNRERMREGGPRGEGPQGDRTRGGGQGERRRGDSGAPGSAPQPPQGPPPPSINP